MVGELVVLEDDERRRAEMARWWNDRHDDHPIVFHATAAEIVRHLTIHWGEVLAVSLDHDLEIIEGAGDTRFDPGSGRDAADFLATRTADFPVVIATTNGPAGDGMEAALEGWLYERVTPYEDLEWVGEAWYPALRRVLRTHASTKVDCPTNAAAKTGETS